MVGDAKRIEMPDFGRARVSQDRFRGLRCVHTHLNGERLTQDDLTDLALLRLDLMSIIQVNDRTGLPDLVYSAHLVPSTAEKLETESQSLPYEFLEPNIPSQLDTDFIGLINSLENEMARNRGTARNRQTNRDRVILVGVTTGYISEAEESLTELEELALSAEAVVLDKILQRRPKIDPRTVLGRGKLDELLVRSMRLGADLIVFDTELSPAQVRAISEATDLKVIDRPQLILDIFAQRARTHEGKLQVELAQLDHMSTRLVRGWTHLERQGGGIGMRGPGETQLETDRRLLRVRLRQIKGRLEKVRSQREQSRRGRSRAEIPTVSLVGYTNAGKSTLFNNVTKSEVYAADQLFATLDPTLRRLDLDDLGPIVLADTVGFIRHLPHKLVEAFRSTLEESSNSDLLLHVIDAAEPDRMLQIEQVMVVLGEIGAQDLPILEVYNKLDLLEGVEPQIQRDEDGKPQRVWLSARDGSGLELLEQAIAELLGSDLFVGTLRLPQRFARLRAQFFELGAVQKEEHDEEGVSLLTVRLPRIELNRLVSREGLQPMEFIEQHTLQ